MTAWAAGLVSLALIGFQIALMQALSIAQWYHFAHLVISVALLGFGAAGSFLAICRRPLLARANMVIALSLLFCGISMPLSTILVRGAATRFDVYVLFVQRGQVGRLLLTQLCFLIPFFFGGLALALIFTSRVRQIGRLYFANLLGSALGGATGLAGLQVLSSAALPGALGGLPLLAALLVLPARRRLPLGLLALGGGVVCWMMTFHPPPTKTSEYKSLSRTLRLPGARVVFDRVHPLGQVQVVTSPALRYAPGLSLTWQAEVPAAAYVFVNGELHGAVPPARRNLLHPLDFTTAALPYALGPHPSVLVLSAGGAEADLARRHGAGRVLVVEPHPVIAELARTGWLDLGAPLAADLVVEDPRAFLAGNREPFDLVLLPPVGAFGGTMGLQAMQEQYLLTREAFAQIWNTLGPAGMVAATAWLDYPPRNPIRLLALLVAMLKDAGVPDPASHIAAVRSWATLTFVVTREPLTPTQVEAVRHFCRERQFDPALLPRLRPDERAAYNQTQDDTLFALLDAMISDTASSLIEAYDFRLTAPTDDRPYFSQFLRWRSLSTLRRAYGETNLPFVELGPLVGTLTLLQVSFLGLVLIFLPLFRLGRAGSGIGRTLLYFGGLGLGFMQLEIALIQRFILVWGHPLYSAAAVIGTLLAGMGLGSLSSSRLIPRRSTCGIVLAVILVFLALLWRTSPALIGALLRWPFAGRVVASVLFLLPPAVVMGLPMPLGLRALEETRPALIPWAWGVNGCLSVVGAGLAGWLAVTSGFSVVLAVAAAAYAAALFTTVTRRA